MAARTKQASRATLDSLLKKPARTREVKIRTVDDSGAETELTMLFKSIGYKDYDDLLSSHQPSKEQSKDGAQWNPDTFPPALISACSVDPVIGLEEAKELWLSDQWSRGELMDLFFAVAKLNTDGLDIPFTAAG